METAIERPRWMERAVRGGPVLFAVSVAVYVVLVVWHPHQLWNMLDLDVYRWGGGLARSGGDVYGSVFNNYLSFTYPPIAALAFVPMSYLPFGILEAFMFSLSLAALVASAWWSFGLAGQQRSATRLGASFAVAAVAVWCEPVQQTLRFGQVDLLLMAVVLYDLSRRDDQRSKGLVIGIATGFKLTPAIFIVYLLLTRRIRSAMVATGAAVATVIVGFLVLPGPSSDFWLDRLFLDSSRVGDVDYVGNQSLHGVAARAIGESSSLWLLIALVVVVLGLRLVVRAHASGDELLAVFVCALTGLLVSPISWTHHWVWLVPGAVLGLEAVRRHPRFTPAAAAPVAAVLAWPAKVTPPGDPFLPYGLVWLADDSASPGAGAGEPILANLYVLAGIGLILALSFARQRRESVSYQRL